MATVNRPNKKAMTDVIDIYRDAMRPFLVHHLKQVRGKRLEEAIGQALGSNWRSRFEDNRRKGNSIEESIDVGDFPELVNFFWSSVFSNIFKGDLSARNHLYDIRNIRNEVAHPGSTDLDAEETRFHIYMVADLLGRINRPEERKAVERVRDKLFGATKGETQPPPSFADHSNLHESDNKYHTEPECKLGLRINNPCPDGRECPRRPKMMCGPCQRIRLAKGSSV